MGGNWYNLEVFLYRELGYRQDKERCGRSASVVLGT